MLLDRAKKKCIKSCCESKKLDDADKDKKH